MINHREATKEEVLKAVRIGQKMSYRHFLMELPRINAKNGVSHRQRSTGKVLLVDEKPCVKHHGRIEQLAGSIATLECGKEIFYDLRIKSEHLK